MTTTPITTTTTPPSTPILYGPLNVEYLNESWCDLQYKSGCSSTGSISHLNHSVNPEILEKLLQEAQKDASSQRQSPTLLPAPHGPAPAHSQPIGPPAAASDDNVKKPATKMSKSATTGSMTLNSSTVAAIKASSTTAFSELAVYLDEEDVDLEYVEDDDEDAPGDDDNDTNVIDDNGEMSSYGTIRSKIPIETCARRRAEACEPNASTPCPNCLKQKKQLEILMEKQLKNEKELIRIRNDYEVKLLNKSLELSTHPSSSSSSTRPVVVSSSEYHISSSNGSSVRSITSSSSGTNTPGQVSAEPLNSRDWIKYFASRPQIQPPKEWNFVHPNSSKSKYANFESNVSAAETCPTLQSKLLSRESIGKLIFTHMASFIVGATLMFLVLKRHLNVRNSIYFV